MLPSRSTGQELDLDVQIQSLMDNVRSGRIPDQLQNVCVSLHPSPQTTIERVIGLTRFRSLSAGEFKTIIVKVRLADAATAPALLSGFPRGLRTPSGNVDVEGELAAALSEKIIQAFDVQLNYEHTALPPGTACTIGREVRLRQAEDGRSVSNISDVASVQHESQIVQARLAFHIALSQNARQGLNSMKAQFPAKATHGLLSDYVQAITQELKYQARILERFDSVPARSARSSISPEQRPSSRSPCGSVLRRPVNAQRSVEAGLNLQAFPHPPLPLRLRRNGARDSSDEARRIWAALRVRKGHVGNSANDQELRQAWSSDTLRQIKQTAENNRRSIGSDTLKSLRYETLQENVAPWL
ncbi:MAG: hypothetical protein LQ340_001290 [Diploschistes diacapsis]|nr:MAG: hypothetical protein LQ340_001290 [Diploschistes diacapsis]